MLEPGDPAPPFTLADPSGKQVSLKAAYGRLRIDRDRGCVDRLSAVYEGSAEELGRPSGRAAANRTVEVGLLTGLSRQELRCGR